MKEDLWAQVAEDEVDGVPQEDELERDEKVLVVGEAHRLGADDEEAPGEELEDDGGDRDEEVGEMSKSAGIERQGLRRRDDEEKGDSRRSRGLLQRRPSDVALEVDVVLLPQCATGASDG